MSTLSAAPRTRLAKCLELLASDQAGEVAAAAQAANKLIKAAGLTWAEVLRPPAVEKRLPELGSWRETVQECLARPGSLRPWEVGFLRDLPDFRRISVKQGYLLKTTADRVLQRGAA